jgi:hypothetical protein
MVADSELAGKFSSALGSIDVPDVPLAQIYQRMREGAAPQRVRFVVPAIAAAAIAIVITVPIFAPAVTQTLEQKIEQIIHWSPPSVPPPASVTDAMRPQTVSLQHAQARVNFTIVAPAGVPSDASRPKITVGPTGVFSRKSRTWSVGPSVVIFSYTRPGGRSFVLSAEAASSQTTPPSKYVFDADVKRFDASGNPIPVKFERFVWRNGDQIMTVIAEDISATEIAAIRTAMHGTPIPTVWPPVHGTDEVKIAVPHP